MQIVSMHCHPVQVRRVSSMHRRIGLLCRVTTPPAANQRTHLGECLAQQSFPTLLDLQQPGGKPVGQLQDFAQVESVQLKLYRKLINNSLHISLTNE